MKTELSKIVSGGQTGVDRAAMELGFPVGGWCPKGRKKLWMVKFQPDIH